MNRTAINLPGWYSRHSGAFCVFLPTLTRKAGLVAFQPRKNHRAAMRYHSNWCDLAAASRLRMHVLGEPVGRQFVAEAAALGLAVDHRAGGGELIAKPDIVEKAGDLLVGLPPLCAAGDQVRNSGQLVELDAATRPTMLVGLLGKREIARAHMDRLLLMHVQRHPVGP